MNDNIEKLHEINTYLDSFIKRDKGDMIEYDPKSNGEWFGVGLYKVKEMAVQRVFMSKGTEIPTHAHPAKEWVIVYRGRFMLNVDGAEMEVGVGESMYFKPNQPHSGVMLEDTWILCVTIPADASYPDAE